MTIRSLLVSIFTLSLIACGFKGSLVLPKTTQNSQATPNQFAPTQFNSESNLTESKLAESAQVVISSHS